MLTRGYCAAAGEPLHTDGRGMEEGMPLMPEQPKQQGKPNRWINEVLYGIINAIVGAPTMISFAAIVYQVHPSHAAPCDVAGRSVSTPTSGITEWPDILYRQDYNIGDPRTIVVAFKRSSHRGTGLLVLKAVWGGLKHAAQLNPWESGMRLSLLRMLCIAE